MEKDEEDPLEGKKIKRGSTGDGKESMRGVTLR